MSREKNRAPSAATHGTVTPTQPVRPLSRPFNISIAALVLLCMSVFWLISSYSLHAVLRDQADRLGNALAAQAAQLVTDLVLANDLISLNVVLSQLTRDGVIAEVAVLGIDDTITAVSRVDLAEPRSLLPLTAAFGEYRADLTLQGARAGAVRVRLDLTYIEQALINNLLLVAAATLLLMIAGVALSASYFAYLVDYPVRMLALGLHRIRHGELETLPEPTGRSELSQTLRHFNATAEFLAQSTFLNRAQQALEDMAEERPLPKPGGPSLDASVLWVRVANFAYLASTHDEVTVVNLLNRLYFLCEKACRLYNGQVSHCQDGDVVISFTAATLEDEQSFYAICTAQLLLDLAPTIGAVNPQDEALPVKLRLAVHSGQCTPGLYSPMTRQTDNVTGAVLDLTRQIIDECPDQAVLVSWAALHLAGEDTRVAGDEFSVVDGETRMIVYLCNRPMASLAPLLERQAELLIGLLDR